MHRRQRDTRGERATGLSRSVLVLGVIAVAGVVVLHVTRRDVDPLRQMMSEYANGPLGMAMTITFYATGLAAIALAIRLGRAILPSRALVFTRSAAAAGGLGLILAGVYEVGRPLDPESVEESVHSAASIGAFCLLVTAMATFAVACRADARWHRHRPVAALLATTAVGLAVTSPLATNAPWGGAVQRMLGLVVVGWLLLTSLEIRRHAAPARAPRPAR